MDLGSQSEKMKVKLFSRVRLFTTLWTRLPGFSVHGILQARTLEWVTISFPRERMFMVASFSSIQSLHHARFFETPWIAACQASLSSTNSLSLLKLMSIELVMTSNHLILCCPLLLPPSIFRSINVLEFYKPRALLHCWEVLLGLKNWGSDSDSLGSKARRIAF